MTPFIFVLMMLAAFVVLLPFIILFGVLGVAAKSLLALILFVAKLMAPVLVICLLLLFVLGFSTGWRRAAILLIAIRIVMLVFTLTGEEAPKLTKAEKVHSIAFSQGWYTDDGAWSYGDESVTEDMSYLDWVYQNVNACTYRRTYEEFVDAENVYTAKLMDDDGDVLSTISIYGSRYLSVDNKYYRVSDDESISHDSMVHLAESTRVKAAIGEWDTFLKEFKDSVRYSSGSIVFTIPGEKPEGDFRITSDIIASYRDENRQVHTYGVELPWDQQEQQSWVPNGEYSIDLGDRKYKSFYLNLHTGSYTLEVNVRNLLPDKYWKYY